MTPIKELFYEHDTQKLQENQLTSSPQDLLRERDRVFVSIKRHLLRQTIVKIQYCFF